MGPKVYTKGIGIKKSPYKSTNIEKSSRSNTFNNNQSSIMNPIIILLATLFCLSLLTMVFFYAQLEAAEHELG